MTSQWSGSQSVAWPRGLVTPQSSLSSLDRPWLTSYLRPAQIHRAGRRFIHPAARPLYATPRFWSLDLPVLTITQPPGVARAARVGELTKLVPQRAPRGRPASTRTWMESVNPLNRPGMDHWFILLCYLLIECIPHMHRVFVASWILHVNLCIQIRGLTISKKKDTRANKNCPWLKPN
jgi:hypothetical protein